jgi:hypothetical protein
VAHIRVHINCGLHKSEPSVRKGDALIPASRSEKPFTKELESIHRSRKSWTNPTRRPSLKACNLFISSSMHMPLRFRCHIFYVKLDIRSYHRL